jgi:apolipoprotein N-acyltransferase
MPFGPLSSPEALQMIGARLPPGVVLIAGALRADDQPLPGQDRRRAFNSLLALRSDASLAALYDKIHLVPFGEYLPFQSTLEAIGLEQLSRMRGGFSSGIIPRPLLSVPGLPPLGVLICYEAIFPAAVIQGKDRPGLIVNITNDGWFGRSIGPYQHLQQTRVRAVEEGVSLVRAANNGVSAIFDPFGRALGELGIDTRATLDKSVPGAVDPPLFASLGHSLFFILAAAMALALSGFRRERS